MKRKKWPELMDFSEWRESELNTVDDDGSSEATEEMAQAYSEYEAAWLDKYSWMKRRA